MIVTCPPKVVPMFKLGYGKTIKEAEYVKEAQWLELPIIQQRS